jgi:hypothetical protein
MIFAFFATVRHTDIALAILSIAESNTMDSWDRLIYTVITEV